jgi:hypothetical protein
METQIYKEKKVIKMSHTFVSCFVDLNRLEDRGGGRDKNFYLQLGLKLLEHPHNFVIFVENESLDELEKLKPYSRIKLVGIDIGDLPVYKILDKNTVKLPDTRNMKKDTYNYLALMISKTHFVEEAIKLNFFESDRFSWIDFGVMHAIKNPEIFSECLGKIDLCQDVEKIKIPGTFRNWYEQEEKFIETYPKINWLFAGSFFFGETKKLLKFCTLVKEALYVLKYFNFITWEINVWAQIYYKDYSFFEWYYADHGDEIFVNF